MSSNSIRPALYMYRPEPPYLRGVEVQEKDDTPSLDYHVEKGEWDMSKINNIAIF